MNDVADAAIAWYDRNARELPWRQSDTSPWAVLVSEVMLQQTPVNRVLPVFLEWMRRWPTPAALAVDKAAEAIRMWGRLGYPRRALRLHTCAVALVEHHDGAVPSNVAELLALPGIGTYTANAVAAFAFGQRQPVVDTNVRRFVARSVMGEEDAVVPLRTVEALLPAHPARAARASIAFMEIGALICTARSPQCPQCPVQSNCAWRANGSPAAAQPVRRTQTYAGTERQIRGALMAVLRDASGPVHRARLDLAWPEPQRRSAALASLLADGLVVSLAPDVYGLAGEDAPANVNVVAPA
ncbi:MAG TPA: A/G-specific adenine glycosylase [Micromonosporaceae bacterium]